MNALVQTWTAMSLRNRLVALSAAALTVLAVLWIAGTAATERMSLLYGGLEGRAAGEVVAALDAMGVVSEVRGDAIYVPTDQRDRVRIALAGEGLPREGQAGYELLDQISGFSTTAEMYRTQVLRARQGELERTILAMRGIARARVHIAQPERRAFGRGDAQTTASVTVTTTAGPLSDTAATSIRFLVALSVTDLSPEQVAVIDTRHGVILAPGDGRAPGLGDDHEARRAERLRAEIASLLAARLGPDAFRVSVTVETSRERETVSQRLIDPDSQSPTSSQTEEMTEDSTGPGGQVTVAGQLPEGDAAAGGGAETQRRESRESLQFQYSETLRDQVTEPGAVRKLGVAVLLDEVAVLADDGAVSYTARPAEELAAIEELVKSAIAFDSERGDSVTIESMRFRDVDRGEDVDPVPTSEVFLRDHGELLIQLGALVLVALVLGLFVIRPILMRDPEPLPEFAGAPALPGGVRLDPAGQPMLGGDGRPLPPLEGAPDAPGEIAALGSPAVQQPLGGADPNAQAGAPAGPRAIVADGLAAAAPPPPQLAPLEAAAIELGQQSIDTVRARPRLEVLRNEVSTKEEQAVALLKRWLNMPHEKSHEEFEAELEARSARANGVKGPTK